jgi:hypothetical protein
MPEPAAICDFPPEKQALLHEILGRIADEWTLLVIEALDGEAGPARQAVVSRQQRRSRHRDDHRARDRG